MKVPFLYYASFPVASEKAIILEYAICLWTEAHFSSKKIAGPT
jgi:hypothetical protein